MIRRAPLVLLLALSACGTDASGGDARPTGDALATDGGAADTVAGVPAPSSTDSAATADTPAAAPADPADRANAGAPADDERTDSAAGRAAAGDSGARENADGSDPYAVLERASIAYEALRSIQAEFRQEARNPILRRTIRSRGTLYQRQPAYFLMRFDEPAGDVIVSDGAHLWVYYPSVDSAQVLRLPAARGAGATDLRSQFIGDPAERFHASSRGTEAVEGRLADILVLEPRAQGEGYRTLTAWIDRQDGLARRFEIVETNGLVRRFELSGIRRNPDLPASLFRFEPPDGVRVVDRG
ncbi:MAG TPA: outer membrane lipoprotein carrier protein LolA [Longimicrobiales bacterium]|nr:outer membrane lipoprotein carrier protein LolA [Longimicrobiales bacterium]